MNAPSAWAERIRSGERRAIARAITAIENDTEHSHEIRVALAQHRGYARVVGVTGPPGAGKSTLVNALIRELLARGHRVAVVAVDPSSPVSGGAVLGDRIRMAENQADERVFIRSLASRGHLGGLTRTAAQVVGVLDAAGFDIVIVETVGAGQAEVEIAGVAGTCLVVCPPGLGDDVQALKAGILEIADLFVVNKADLPDAARTESELLSMLALRGQGPQPPVLKTVATRGEGIAAIAEFIEKHEPRVRRIASPSGQAAGGLLASPMSREIEVGARSAAINCAMFLRNCWYVIAWDYEVPADGLFARTVLNEPILVFRTQGGRFVALEDRCCHRHAPLSKGRKEGDSVRCGYHGLKFDAGGACVEAPGLDRIPPQARVKTYPVAVRNKWVFVWMGEAAGADERLLPDNYSNEHADWRNKPGYLHYATPYLLICDNLLDFSHLSYVHEKTLGGSTAIAQARAEIEPLERGVRVSRRVPNVPPPPYYHKIRKFDSNVDRWFIYDFLFPGTLLMNSGGKPAGQQEPDPANSVLLHSCQTLTPETDNTTHYFFQQSHRADAGDASVTEGIYQNLIAAFNEDRDMITAQCETIRRNPGAPMMPLGIDSALVRYRKLLEEAIARERA